MSAAPLLVALLMWFIGTASVVWLVSRPHATFRGSLTGAAITASIAAMAIAATATDTGPTGAYIGFASAILIWGWHEIAFLTGAVSGPNRAQCPAGASGFQRFRAATATVIHHELALAATALLLFALTWGGPNQAAPLTFLLLFVMRLSAKFNLYLGVPNLSDEVFPTHLEHLKSYFRVARLNLLFPFSIALGVAIAAWGWTAGHSAPAGSGASITALLICGLATLAVIEHLFLVLPMRDSKLWSWASSNQKAVRAATSD